jgi:hypothetical protein
MTSFREPMDFRGLRSEKRSRAMIREDSIALRSAAEPEEFTFGSHRRHEIRRLAVGLAEEITKTCSTSLIS